MQDNQNTHMGFSNADGSPGVPKEPPRVITVKVQSILDRADLAAIDMRTDSTVRELRFALKGRIGGRGDDQTMLFEGKELKDDEKTLADYGMQDDCVVQLAPRMASGSRSRGATTTNVILLVPYMIPNGVKTIEDLRNTIKNLGRNDKPSTPSKDETNKKAEAWTPEKQMEHVLTRNRMKELMQRRKKMKAAPKSSILATDALHSDSAHSPAHSVPDTGSICGSVGMSPLASEPGTPPEVRLMRKNNSDTKDTVVEPRDPSTVPVTEKELKTYFEPPETARQAEMFRRDLYDPPQNRDELARLKNELQERQKSMCGVCHKRLPLIQQSLKCRCGQVFCSRHRSAEQHKCNVDYKLAGRKKLEKENPKLESGGAHKAKSEDV